MKKFLTWILVFCMAMSLCACGGGGSGSGTPTTPPNNTASVGFYDLIAMEQSGDYIDVSILGDFGVGEYGYVQMKEDGTAVIMLEGDLLKATYNGNTFVLENDDAIDYRLDGDTLMVYYEDELTYYYQKTDAPIGADKPEPDGDAFGPDLIEIMDGDFHGICTVANGAGLFEDMTDSSFEIIGRFLFDEDGYCTPFLAAAVEDSEDDFQDLTVSYDLNYDCMVFSGELFGVTIAEGSFTYYDNGFVYGLIVLEDGEDYADIYIGMRQIGDTWESEDDPYMPEEMQEYYQDMDLIDIAGLFGVDLDLIPEE